MADAERAKADAERQAREAKAAEAEADAERARAEAAITDAELQAKLRFFDNMHWTRRRRPLDDEASKRPDDRGHEAVSWRAQHARKRCKALRRLVWKLPCHADAVPAAREQLQWRRLLRPERNVIIGCQHHHPMPRTMTLQLGARLGAGGTSDVYWLSCSVAPAGGNTVQAESAAVKLPRAATATVCRAYEAAVHALMALAKGNAAEAAVLPSLLAYGAWRVRILAGAAWAEARPVVAGATSGAGWRGACERAAGSLQRGQSQWKRCWPHCLRPTPVCRHRGTRCVGRAQ